MSIRPLRYILYSDALNGESVGGRCGGRWHFVLESVDGSFVIEADEHEPDPSARGERLELLSVVRGLEALDQPSQVTLVTASRYVRRGLRFGLGEWRRNGWCWEHFGRLVPIKNQDLWRRVDRALRYHEVECRYWRLDAAHGSSHHVAAPPRSDTPAADCDDRRGGPVGRVIQGRLSRPRHWLAARVRAMAETGHSQGLVAT